MKICNNCEMEIEDDRHICESCGCEIFKPVLLEVEETKAQKDNDYTDIGGLLILVAIGRIIGPFLLINASIKNIIFFYNKYYILSKVFRVNNVSVLFPYILYELLSSILIFITDIILIYLLFKKKKLFPKVMVSYILFMFFYYVVEYIICRYFLTEICSLTSRSIFISLISCLTWIPYFLLSERVKHTFIN